MKPENEAVLKKHHHHWETIKNAQYLRGMNIHERGDMLRVMREEFQPNFETCMGCPTDLYNFVKRLYTLYEKWKAEQPITVAANFPYHEKPEQ